MKATLEHSLPDPEVVKTLTEARALIKKGWTQGWFAVDSDGYRVDVDAEEAVKWCVLGALIRVNGPGEKEATNLLEKLVGPPLQRVAGWIAPTLPVFNDTLGRTKKEILALFDRAIEEASK